MTTEVEKWQVGWNQTASQHYDLASKFPVSDEAWVRACEIEQEAAHAFFKHRAEQGFSVPASVFGFLVSIGMLAGHLFEPDAVGMMKETLEEAFNNERR